MSFNLLFTLGSDNTIELPVLVNTQHSIQETFEYFELYTWLFLIATLVY